MKQTMEGNVFQKRKRAERQQATCLKPQSGQNQAHSSPSPGWPAALQVSTRTIHSLGMGSHHWKSPISPHPASFLAIHQASFSLGPLLPPLSYRGSGPPHLTTLESRRSELFLAFKRHPSKQQHILMTVLGNSLESPLSPSVPDSRAPSLVSGPTRCFTHQIPYLPLLPYFGVTSKLLPRDFLVLYGFHLC